MSTHSKNRVWTLFFDTNRVKSTLMCMCTHSTHMYTHIFKFLRKNLDFALKKATICIFFEFKKIT